MTVLDLQAELSAHKAEILQVLQLEAAHRALEAAVAEIAARELQQCDRRFRGSAEEAEQALEALVRSGIGTWEPCPPGPTGGRPTRVFRLSQGVYVYETSRFSEGNGVGSVDVDVDGLNKPAVDPGEGGIEEVPL